MPLETESRAELEKFLHDISQKAFLVGGVKDPNFTVDDARLIVHDVLAAAAQRWNSSRPVNRIPPRVLSRIYWELPILERLAVRRTCRYWRNAAEGDPRLWNALVFKSERHGHPRLEGTDVIEWKRSDFLLEVMNWTSPDAPVDITIYGIGEAYVNPVCDMLHSFAHHLHALRLSISVSPHDDKAKSLVAALYTPAPLLEHLALRHEVTMSAPFSATISAPGLRYIDLNRVEINGVPEGVVDLAAEEQEVMWPGDLIGYRARYS
ncbi:hypothetical protein EXIGLDRAFT_760115 [Exidia glandulosa HHB12029]|uniref:F-box domain-containing protein n=1 Tax=Exidia glandulosa HHB12029 TaxID=1314781 RepID=A0A166BLP6_EXIGL|nr:hypothetical protein EXIGLDRAFT_760115 [Exidia glandulosa HHB12029]